MTSKNNEIPSRPRWTRRSSRSRRLLFVAALAVGAPAALIIVASRMLHSLNGPPFQMVVEPDDDHVIVQFSQIGTALKSKPFRIDGHVKERQVVVLDSPRVAVPGGHIEFADTTLLPGRFTIRLGQTVFDVMPGGINVDRQKFEWLHGDPAH